MKTAHTETMTCEVCGGYEYRHVSTGKGVTRKRVEPGKESRKGKPVTSFVCSRCAARKGE